MVEYSILQLEGKAATYILEDVHIRLWALKCACSIAVRIGTSPLRAVFPGSRCSATNECAADVSAMSTLQNE